MKALTTVELDIVTAGGCATPGCKHMHDPDMYIHARCHIKADLHVRYDSRDHQLHLECAECGSPVADVKVAEP